MSVEWLLEHIMLEMNSQDLGNNIFLWLTQEFNNAWIIKKI